MVALADEILEDVDDFRSVAAFHPRSSEFEEPSSVRTTIGAAICEADELEPGRTSSDVVTTAVTELQAVLRLWAGDASAVPEPLRKRALRVLDRTCDLVFGGRPLTAYS